MRLGFDNGEPFDTLEISVAADERCTDSERGCGDPEVVTSEWRNWLTWQSGEQLPFFLFPFGLAPSRSQPV